MSLNNKIDENRKKYHDLDTAVIPLFKRKLKSLQVIQK